MKIAISGTRGIPNNYGGFEQFAEYLAKGLVEMGHEVYVYNPHNHPYNEKMWCGVHIIHKFDPEKFIGTAGQFIYDLNCILDSRKRRYDIILQLGYTSNSIWGALLPKYSIVVTNMDGLEWKRAKYSNVTKRYLLLAEKWAVKSSNFLISDSKGIQDYLQEKYNLESKFIPYGAKNFDSPNFDIVYQKFNLLEKFNYDMLIARMEPENNIEMILKGFSDSNTQRYLLVIGNCNNKFGKLMTRLFCNDQRIKFLGGIYNLGLLNNLRYFSNIYFHGHSVGRTNPSLLEAMASKTLICAHKNVFNYSILKSNAFYFVKSNDVKEVVETVIKSDHGSLIKNNEIEINEIYAWDIIISKYENYLNSLSLV